ELTFSMLLFVLRNPSQKASPFARSTLNPYLPIPHSANCPLTSYTERQHHMLKDPPPHHIPWHSTREETQRWTMLRSVCVPPSQGLVHVRYGVGRLPYGCWDVRSALDVKVKDRDEECHMHDKEEHCHKRRRWTDDMMDVPGEGAEADDFSGESTTDNKGDSEQVKTLLLILTSQTLIENTEHSESPVRRRHLCTLLA
ncbi:hypothetical protein PAXRUDRAFT_114878, partial [Paxillus rubicundulus Ve08.2h10]